MTVKTAINYNYYIVTPGLFKTKLFQNCTGTVQKVISKVNYESYVLNLNVWDV